MATSIRTPLPFERWSQDQRARSNERIAELDRQIELEKLRIHNTPVVTPAPQPVYTAPPVQPAPQPAPASPQLTLTPDQMNTLAQQVANAMKNP